MKNKLLATLSSFLCGLIVLLGAPLVRADLNLELPDLNLPDLADSPIPDIGFTEEHNLGLKVLRKLRASGQIIEDPEITSWIQSLGNRLAARASRSGHSFYFVVSKNNSINAFAAMGGVVVINAGLIIKTDSESELAAVVSHEIAHVTQRHLARMLEKSKQNTFGRSAAMLAGVLAGTKNPQVGSAIITTTMATAMHKQLSFSREAESEADSVGLRILASAGFDPQGMPLFLQKLERLSDDRFSDISEYLQSHPLAHKRVVDTQLRASRMGPYRGKEHESYRYMREKVRALSQSASAPAAKLSPRLKQYARALKYEKTGQYRQALNTLGAQSRQMYEASLIASLLNKQRQFKKTQQLLTPLLRTYPGNVTLSMLLAQATLALGQAEQAWNIIRTIPIAEQTSLEFLEVRQRIAHSAGRDAEAYRTAAERNIRMGEYKYAAIQLRKAMKQRDANAAQLIQFQKILSQVEADLNDQRAKARR